MAFQVRPTLCAFPLPSTVRCTTVSFFFCRCNFSIDLLFAIALSNKLVSIVISRNRNILCSIIFLNFFFFFFFFILLLQLNRLGHLVRRAFDSSIDISTVSGLSSREKVNYSSSVEAHKGTQRSVRVKCTRVHLHRGLRRCACPFLFATNRSTLLKNRIFTA